MTALILVTFATVVSTQSVNKAFCDDSPSVPNIVLIMADDMGYSDIGCYGGEIQTPHLDALARDGVRFTQFYNTGRCCPTRASLLTGLYSHQAGVGWMTNDRHLPGYQGDLNDHCLTIAQVLKTAGYATYMSGKWHVTKDIAPDGLKLNWPCQRGFDRFFGTIQGAGSYYDPSTLTIDNKMIVPPTKDFYYTDAIADHAAGFIDDHAKRTPDKPWFMYVAFTSPHWPMHAPAEEIAKYKGTYDQGWDAIRKTRHRRMIRMGLVDEKWPLTPRDTRSPAWEKAKRKRWNIRCMEVYAAMIDRMDQGIGRICESLKKTDQFDNTLILFLADNGGCAEGMGRGGKFTPRPTDKSKLRPMKPGQLQTRMVPRYTRDGYPVRQGPGVMPGTADTYIGYGLSWANASNTPFRLYKHWVHEGGISTPLIAHWPKQIKRKGELIHQSGHLIDIMATCIDVSGASYPKQYNGKPIHPPEGRSLLGAFDGKMIDRDALYWEHEGNRAIRQGKWKLVAKGAHGRWELYDMDTDRTELNDLATKHPDRTQAMAKKWNAWATRANVFPWPWDKKKKAANKKAKLSKK